MQEVKLIFRSGYVVTLLLKNFQVEKDEYGNLVEFFCEGGKGWEPLHLKLSEIVGVLSREVMQPD